MYSDHPHVTKTIVASTVAFLSGRLELAYNLLSESCFAAVEQRDIELLRQVVRTAERRRRVLSIDDVVLYANLYDTLGLVADAYCQLFQPCVNLLDDTSVKTRALYYASLS